MSMHTDVYLYIHVYIDMSIVYISMYTCVCVMIMPAQIINIPKTDACTFVHKVTIAYLKVCTYLNILGHTTENSLINA